MRLRYSISFVLVAASILLVGAYKPNQPCCQGNCVNQWTAKGSPVGADIMMIEDSADSWKGKKATISSLPVTAYDTFSFRVAGVVSASAGVDVAWIAPRACTITRITLYRRTAGDADSTIVDVNKNGTTVYTTQGNRPTVASGAGDNAIDATTDMDVTAVAQDDRIECDVDAVEGGDPEDVSVVVEVRY